MQVPNLNRIFLTSLLFFIALCLSSCLELVEDVTVHADGSGEMKLTINLSRSKSEIDKLMLKDSINGVKIPHQEDLDAALAQAKTSLENQEGISDLKIEKNYSDFIFRFSYHFEDIEALNYSFKTVVASLEGKELEDTRLPFDYSMSNSKWTRSYVPEFLDHLNDQISGFGFGELKSSKITSIYRFDQGVKSTSFPDTRISKSGKSTMTQVTLERALSDYDYRVLSITTK